MKSGSSKDSRKRKRSRSRSREKKYDLHDRYRGSSNRDVKRDDRVQSRERGNERRDKRRESKDRSRSRHTRSHEQSRYRSKSRRKSSEDSYSSRSRSSDSRGRNKKSSRNTKHYRDDKYASKNSSKRNRQDERERSRDRDRDRRGGRSNKKDDMPDSMASHPYFQQKNKQQPSKKGGLNVDEEGNELFWDGFQWVPRQRQKAYFNPWQEHMIEKIVNITNHTKEENLERVAKSRTVIVDNLSLDLGSTSKELQKWFLEQLRSIGISNVQIVDIDVDSGGADNSVQVELEHQDMIDLFKKLDGVQCLGESIKVRKVGEETTQTNAQAAVIALTALQEITGRRTVGGRKEDAKLLNQPDEGIDPDIQPEAHEELIGPQNALGQNATSLKTLNPSRYIKISNVFERDLNLTDEIREELRLDFVEEMNSVTKFKSMVVINRDIAKLGAETGSIFIEFANIKNAQAGMKKVKGPTGEGRRYDGFEIKTAFISEKLWSQYFFPELPKTTVVQENLPEKQAETET